MGDDHNVNSVMRLVRNAGYLVIDAEPALYIYKGTYKVAASNYPKDKYTNVLERKLRKQGLELIGFSWRGATNRHYAWVRLVDHPDAHYTDAAQIQ